MMACTACTCHRETGTNHEQCCGHLEGRDPDCPQHGDGSGPDHEHDFDYSFYPAGTCRICGYND